VVVTISSYCHWNCRAQSPLGNHEYIPINKACFQVCRILWLNWLIRLTQNREIFSSLEFSNSVCGNFNFAFLATCAQLGVWAAGQRRASFTDSLYGIQRHCWKPWSFGLINYSFINKLSALGILTDSVGPQRSEFEILLWLYWILLLLCWNSSWMCYELLLTMNSYMLICSMNSWFRIIYMN
jgi:hypothetical protein